MYPLVEAVRIENRQLHHLDLHNRRINLARQAIYRSTDQVDIGSIVQLPDDLSTERYKCRLIFYPGKVEYSITPYHQREIRTLKVVADNDIDYTFKSENRLKLDEDFAKREDCDDIIVVKNNKVTDSWAANIILFDGKEWITPDAPLLRGIQREYLLREGRLIEKEVTVNDLITFKKIKLINAMIDFERAPEISVPEGLSF